MVASGPPPMSEVVALDVGVEAGGVGAARCLRNQHGLSAGAPAPGSEPDCNGRQHEADQRDEPGAVLLRLGEDRRAELRDEGVLDLLLRLARVDLLLDERALAPCGRGLRGHVERDAALEAHHLVGDVAERGLRAAGGRGGRGEDEAQGEQRRQQPHWRLSSVSGTTFSVKKRSSTGPRRVAAIRPLRSSTTVSGYWSTPKSPRWAPSASRSCG